MSSDKHVGRCVYDFEQEGWSQLKTLPLSWSSEEADGHYSVRTLSTVITSRYLSRCTTKQV